MLIVFRTISHITHCPEFSIQAALQLVGLTTDDKLTSHNFQGTFINVGSVEYLQIYSNDLKGGPSYAKYQHAV